MNTPSRNRNLILVIAALLLTNIAVLAYFLWLKPHKPKGPPDKPRVDMPSRLRDSIGFNDAQVAEYLKLREEQRTKMGTMYDEMRKAKDNLFKLLSDSNASDSLIGKASDVIAEKQKALDVSTFNHFKRIRALCTPEQQPRYDTMIQRMFRKMNRPPMKANARDKDDKGNKRH